MTYLFDAAVMIPNAFAILFFSLHAFRDQGNRLAVSASDSGAFADGDIACHKRTGYMCTRFNDGTRHKHTVRNDSSLSDKCVGKEHGPIYCGGADTSSV